MKKALKDFGWSVMAKALSIVDFVMRYPKQIIQFVLSAGSIAMGIYLLHYNLISWRAFCELSDFINVAFVFFAFGCIIVGLWGMFILMFGKVKVGGRK